MRPKYFPKPRQPQNEAIVPLTLKKPLELKSALMGSGGREKGQVCLYELSLLLACFKQSGFSQVACGSEINNFQKCFYSERMKREQYGKRKETVTPKDEVNRLLKKYST